MGSVENRVCVPRSNNPFLCHSSVPNTHSLIPHPGKEYRAQTNNPFLCHRHRPIEVTPSFTPGWHSLPQISPLVDTIFPKILRKVYIQPIVFLHPLSSISTLYRSIKQPIEIPRTNQIILLIVNDSFNRYRVSQGWSGWWPFELCDCLWLHW